MDISGTIADWCAWMRGIGRAERTISERHTTLWHFFEYTGTTPEDFTQRHVVRYLGRKGLKPASRASYYTQIKAFAKWAVLIGLRDDNPMTDLPAPRRPKCVPRPITNGDFIALLESTPRQITRVKIMLGALQGLRAHEIAKVHGGDFDVHAMQLRVQGKGGDTAVIPLHPGMLELVEIMPQRAYWFPSKATSTGHVTAKSVSTVMSHAMQRAGVPATGHQLRHWFGTNLLTTGADLRTVQELMRHESITSTQIYTLVPNERRVEALARLELPKVA